MTKKSYAMNVSVILGATAVLLVFIFILVSHHQSNAERVRLDGNALRSTGSSVVERSKPVGQVNTLPAQTQPEQEKK